MKNLPLSRPPGLLPRVWKAALVPKASRTQADIYWMCFWSAYQRRHPKVRRRGGSRQRPALPDLSTASRYKRLARHYLKQLRRLTTTP